MKAATKHRLNVEEASGCPEPAQLSSRSRAARERARAEETLYYAVGWFVQHVPPPPPKRAFSGNEAHERTLETRATELWRRRDGALTSAASARFAVDDASPSACDDTGPIVTEVETEALGRVRLAVERSSRGISVVIAVSNEQVAAANVQRVALQRALEGAGLAVANVTVTCLDGDGPAFARGALETDAAGDAWVRGGTLHRAAASHTVPAPERLLCTVG